MKNRNSSLLLSILFMAFTCAAKEPAPRIADLTATDGTKLKASYFAAGKPGPGVLLLHQCDHERKIWDGLAQQLAAAGIHVLTFDLRGFGESGGEPHSTSKVGPIEPPEEMQKWPDDIDVAYQYLKSQEGVKSDSIGVGGASCGVDNSIKTAMRHREVKSLVLLAGPTDLKGRQFLRKTSLPVFFAVADDDQYPFMVQLTEWLYLVTPTQGKKFLHYQTGRHGAEIFSVHPDLPKAIVDWYVTTLIKPPGRAPASKDNPAILSEVQTLDLLEQPGGPAKLAQSFSESRQKDPRASLVSRQMLSESGQKDPKELEKTMERMIDSLGNEHFEAGDIEQAVEIEKLQLTEVEDSEILAGGIMEVMAR